MHSSCLRTGLVFLVAGAITVLGVGTAVAAPLRDVPQTVTQPDGTVLHLLASGDEYYNWMHDEKGFVVLRNKATGWLEYAVKVDGRLEPSGVVVGRGDAEAAGISPSLRPDPGTLPLPRELFPRPEAIQAQGARPGSAFTSINNIVVFIRFADQAEFEDPISFYDGIHNASGAGAVSEYAYFREDSYQKLTIQSRFYPAASGGYVVSYRDAHPRSYFMPYDAYSSPDGYDPNSSTDRASREHTLLASAVNAVSSQIASSLNVDTNSDGLVDSVVFIVRGEPTAWATLLWPHQWEMSAQVPVTATINGKTVDAYNFQLEINNQGNKLLVGVLCHEMSHTLGAPDLYHYDNCSSAPDLQPAAKWDLMENDLTPPQHHTAFMKQKYFGWISTIPTITATGTYTLSPITSSTTNAYRINSPNSTKEYFIVEYRRNTGTFESSLPASGLLVYRINTDIPAGQWGNNCGPPDELYVYRPDGTLTSNGSPDDAPLGIDTMRAAMNDSTNPSGFLSNGSPGGLDISQVTVSGASVSFKVTVGSSGGTETTIFQDGFEGSFPGQWQYYKPASKANTEWGRTTFRDNGGNYSVWCAAGGTSPQPAGGDYVPNMGTWLYYGPFSLVGATDAWAELDLWLDSEATYDFVKWMISVNDVNYFGRTRSGTTNGWEHVTFNFKEVSDIAAVGASQVWFALIFESDSGTQGKGAFVDNVVIKKKSASTCTYQLSSSSQAMGPAGGTGTFGVTAGTGCTWTAASNVGWIQVTQGASGSGSGTVGYSVSANSGAARVGTVTAAGKTFTVNQSAGTVVCTHSYWVPVGSHAAGSNQSQWRTDLSLLGRSGTATSVDVRLYTTSGMVSRVTSVAGGAQEILRDAVGWVSSGYSGSGALQVCSGQPLLVTSRTYNLVASTASCYPNGTFGQFYDSIASGGGLNSGQTAWLPGLSEGTSFRCNIGLTNTGTSNATVTVTLHNQAGTQIGSYPVSLSPGQWKQENQPFKSKAGQTAMDRGYAKVTVNAGTGVIAYASVIDNLTNDPITVPMKQ